MAISDLPRDYDETYLNRHEEDEDDEYAVYNVSRPLRTLETKEEENFPPPGGGDEAKIVSDNLSDPDNGDKIKTDIEVSDSLSRNHESTSDNIENDKTKIAEPPIIKNVERQPVVEGKQQAEKENKSLLTLVDDPYIAEKLKNPIVGNSIESIKGSGEDLSEELLSSLGFSELKGIRIYTDDKAILFCELLNARAFTHGKNIFFNKEEFNTSTPDGIELLSHELQHVQQQSSGRTNVQRQVKDPVEDIIRLSSIPNLSEREMVQLITLLDHIGAERTEKFFITYPDLKAPVENTRALLEKDLDKYDKLWKSNRPQDYEHMAPLTNVGEGVDASKIENTLPGESAIGQGKILEGMQFTFDGDGDMSKELVMIFKGHTDTGTQTILDIYVNHLYSKETKGPFKITVDDISTENIGAVLSEETDSVRSTEFIIYDKTGKSTSQYIIDIEPPDAKQDYNGKYGLRLAKNNHEFEPQFHEVSFKTETWYRDSILHTYASEEGIPTIDLNFYHYGDHFRYTLRKNTNVTPERNTVFMQAFGITSKWVTSQDEFEIVVNKPFEELKFTVLREGDTFVELDLDGDGLENITIYSRTYTIPDGTGENVRENRYIDLIYRTDAPGDETLTQTFHYSGGDYGGRQITSEEDFQEFALQRSTNDLRHIQIPENFEQEIGKLNGEINAVFLEAAKENVVDPKTFKAYESLSINMIQALEVLIKVEGEESIEQQSILKATVEKADLFYSLFKEETKDHFSTSEAATEVSSTSTKSNPYTGQTETTLFVPFLDADTEYNELELGKVIQERNWPEVQRIYNRLTTGYIEWLGNQLKAKKPEKANVGTALTRKAQQRQGLDELHNDPNIKYLTHLRASYYSWETFNNGKGIESVELPLYYYYKESEKEWVIIDYMHAGENPFYVSQETDLIPDAAKPEPPGNLFQKLNHKDHLPQGIMVYETPYGSGGEVILTEPWTAADIVAVLGLGVAAVGITLATLGTATPAVITTIFAVSAGLSATSAGLDMYDKYSHGQLTEKVILLNTAQIIASVAQLKLAAFGQIASRSARFAQFAQGLYLPLKAGSIAGEGIQVLVLTYDSVVQMNAVLNGPGSVEDKTRALSILFSQFAITGGLYVLDLKGEQEEISTFMNKEKTLVFDETPDSWGESGQQPYVHLDEASTTANVHVDDVNTERLADLEISTIDNNVRRELNVSLGEKRIKELDEMILQNQQQADGLLQVYGTRDTYHAMNVENGDLAKARLRLEGQHPNMQLEYNTIKAFAESKGLTNVKRENGRWEVTNADGQVVREYEIGAYSEELSKGTKKFYEAHHGIQDLWGRNNIQEFCRKYNIPNPYRMNTVGKGLDCPAINLRDTFGNSPHGATKSLQTNRRPNLPNYNYEDMQYYLIEDLTAAGVPRNFIDELLLESDTYFRSLYNTMKIELEAKGVHNEEEISNILAELFGNFK